MKFEKFSKVGLVAVLAIVAIFFTVTNGYAATPSGDEWFQLRASPFTGGDNTGDGGTGLPGDLNYFYVGQTFTSNIEIQAAAPGTNAANIWIDYNTLKVTASGLSTGTYYPSWSGQTISGGRVKSTGYRTTGYSTGNGNFGSLQWTINEPNAFNYGTGAPLTLDINVGVIGATTESNISYDGSDNLDDEEDFVMHLWADTVKPYGLNPGPANASINVAVETNYTFDLRDSLNGEGDNSGVGTGMNIATPPGVITFNATDYTTWDAYSCSGVWGTNLCNTTVNPPSPLGIAGDQRNWEYNTLYTVNVNSFQDLASPSQNQLGDTNGPNTMDPKTWTFTTEADTVAPRVVAESPLRNSTGNSVSTNVDITVHDKKTYPGSISGTGVVSNTCRFDVWSDSVATTTYQEGMGTVGVAAVDYGYQFTLNPAVDFAQNEWVYVLARDCEDLVSNVMMDDLWRFQTADTDPPYVDQQSPADDMGIVTNGTVDLHVKDDGVGVDLATLVIYVNGVYYKSAAGGAGFVTINGTRITYASTLAFTSLAGTVNDYTISIDPVDFTPGEAVPVIVYAKDLSNNIMERVVYGMCVGGGTGQICGNSAIEGNEVCDDGNTAGGDGCSANCLSSEVCGNNLKELVEECDDGNVISGDGCSATCIFEGTGGSGSTFCGSNTSWNGTSCIASCSVAGSGGSPGVAPLLSVNITTLQAIQIDEDSVMIYWTTNLPATQRVVFGSNSLVSMGQAPNYGYAYSTEEVNTNSMIHQVVIDGLTPGTLYAFRPVSKGNGNEIYGPEILMAPLFVDMRTETIEKEVTERVEEICPVPEEARTVTETEYIYRDTAPGTTVPTGYGTQGDGAGGAGAGGSSLLEITNIDYIDSNAFIYGTFRESSKLKIYIY